MVSHRTCVWVKTSALNGSNGVGTKKGVVSHDDADESDWGWVLATLVSSGTEDEAGDTVQVIVYDEESQYHLKTMTVKRVRADSSNEDGSDPYVMANTFEAEEIDAAENGDSNFDDEDDDDDGPPDDLINLVHLHEPALVYSLRKRFDVDKIYTSTGPILLALNPFKYCKELYDDSVMGAYSQRGEMRMMGGGDEESSGGAKLGPHVFGTADNTFRCMMKCLEDGGGKSPGTVKDQAILVSGESGAGKTVTTKHIMMYLATLSQRRNKMKASAGPTKLSSATSGSSSLRGGDVEQKGEIMQFPS